LTRGNYKSLAELFNVPLDTKRLLNFLRKHDCHMPMSEARSATARVTNISGRPVLPRAASQ